MCASCPLELQRGCAHGTSERKSTPPKSGHSHPPELGYTRSMKTRRLGRTNLQISELTLGGGMVGGLLIRESDATRREAIRRTLAAGINWIDTAPSYGAGESERALGWILAETQAAVHVSTKFRIDPNDRDFAGQLEASLCESLERLQRPQVDLVQLHNRVMPQAGRASLGVSDILGSGGVADALDQMVARGLVRYRGLTAIGDAQSCHEVIESGRFDTAQIYYNLLNPTAGQTVPDAWSAYDFAGLISACKRQDMGTLCIRVLAAGVIATDLRHGREGSLVPGTEVARDERRTQALFRALGTRYGTRAQTAIRFVLANPDVSSAIVGIADLDQLDEMLAVGALGPLPAEGLETIQKIYAAGIQE